MRQACREIYRLHERFASVCAMGSRGATFNLVLVDGGALSGFFLVHPARWLANRAEWTISGPFPGVVLVLLARLIRERSDAGSSRFYSFIRQMTGQMVGKSLMKLSENDE